MSNDKLCSDIRKYLLSPFIQIGGPIKSIHFLSIADQDVNLFSRKANKKPLRYQIPVHYTEIVTRNEIPMSFNTRYFTNKKQNINCNKKFIIQQNKDNGQNISTWLKNIESVLQIGGKFPIETYFMRVKCMFEHSDDRSHVV